MTKIVITDHLKDELLKFLKKNRKADAVSTYFYFLEKKFQLKPVLFIREKKIYQSLDELIKRLEEQGKLWRETEIKIQFGEQGVNEQTAKIYICPFTGKTFADNTHPNPQDAIYDWVSRCPENTEKVDGLRVKRFFVSDDPEVIKNYIVKRKEPVTKVVYSSALTGKLFNSKANVIDDFIKNQLKPLDLAEVPRQNRYQFEDRFLAFMQEHLDETKINEFVESVAKIDEFSAYVSGWFDESSEEG